MPREQLEEARQKEAARRRSKVNQFAATRSTSSAGVDQDGEGGYDQHSENHGNEDEDYDEPVAKKLGRSVSRKH